MTSLGKLRFALGSVIMFGVAPEYFALWAVWRGASIFMPGWVYQWGDDKLYSLYQRLVLFFFETCTQVEVVLYGEAEEILKTKENVLYLANHQSTADWLVANMVAIRGSSIGNMRYVMKDTLQLIPLYGHYFYAHGCIYVKRGKFNQQKMIQALEYLKHKKMSTWMIIFPEGTRYYPSTPKVIEQSEQYARDNNLQVLNHHLVPKSRGLWLTLQHAASNFDAVYDISVIYENSVDAEGTRLNAPQLASFLTGSCPRLHIHIRRIPINELPCSEEKLKVWMYNLFLEKDK
ncbi:UNVERIFIED_CONTAM: hypothetical protein GTU68_048043 [Idotea baltica]|nr:hypothetical protein [Idotea baltica]